MGIAVSLLAARQNPASNTVVMWSGADPTARTLVLVVARRRLDPDELEQAVTAGHPDAEVVRFPATAGAVQDDLTPGGEPRYYGILAVAGDGSFKPARFRAGPMSELPEGTVKYSAIGGRGLAGAPAASSVPPPARPAAPSAAPQPPPVTGSAPVRGPFAPGAPPATPQPPPVTGSAPVRGPFAPSAPPAAPQPAPITGSAPIRGPFAPGAPSAPPMPPPVTGSTSVRPTAPPPAPAVDPLEARRQAQLRAQQQAAAASGEAAPAVDPAEARRQAQLRAQQQAAATGGESAAAVDPMEARRQAQARAQQQAAALQSSSFAMPTPAQADAMSGGATGVFRAAAAPPSEFPTDRFGLRMIGATQSWDGLRVQWESDGKPATAYEVYVSDHPLSPEEVGELIRGEKLHGSSVRAVVASQKSVIDNVTPRDARGYYAVVARDDSGLREQVGCVCLGTDQGGSKDAPFLDPLALDEVRSIANGMVQEARMQLLIFKEEGDVGAWREALRLCDDARVVYPDFAPARAMEREIRAARGQ